jgi:hypothetical protein
MTDERTAGLTPDALREIRARADKATPGPWDWDESGVFTLNEGGMGGPVLNAHDPSTPPLGGIGRVGDPYPRGINSPSESMAFIAAAREDVPALCREVRRLQAVLSEIEQEARTSFDESHFTGRVSGERFQRILNAARRALAHRPVSRTTPNAEARVTELEALLGRFAASAIASANNAQSIWLAQDDWDELRKLAALAPVATAPGDARD